jgi:hypothetical protein
MVDGNATESGDATPLAERGESAGMEALRPSTRDLQPVGYITTDFLAALWDERSRQLEQHRKNEPDDIREIESRQRAATQAFQAYRFFAELEQQLGFEVALPIVGTWRGPNRPV